MVIIQTNLIIIVINKRYLINKIDETNELSLIDFLDFDTELSRNELLWKAYKPTAVYEKEGDIYVTVPFQKQKLANDMMADTDVPQEEYTLIIRQYNIGITRLFLGFGDYVLTDESEMLQFSDRIQKVPLFIKEQKGKWILSTEDGTKRAVINVEEPLLDRWSELLPDPQETLDITLYPDGKREIRLSAYDHFSPPRYDALPVAFANATVGKNVQRFLLNVSPMNVLPEPENVSLKWT